MVNIRSILGFGASWLVFSAQAGLLDTDERSSPQLDDSIHADNELFFANYQPLSAIDPWLRLLTSLYSSHAELINIGQTAEGRTIDGLRIGAKHDGDEAGSRSTILIVGGLHAREWISTTTVLYIASALTKRYGSDKKITHLLEHFDFVLIPTLNPDGYEYTWTTDRLWRKTRQATNVRFCPGHDLDRSFDFAWAARENSCSESYGGAQPLEAVEAASLASWAKQQTESGNVTFAAFLDLHSYSETILYPYSYTCKTEPPGLENLEELAAGMRRAISEVNGHHYALMPACEENNFAAAASSSSSSSSTTTTAEPAGGSALDYFYHEHGIRYSYQIKLRDHGSYGFLLPKEEIVPTGKEILAAVTFLAEFLHDADDLDDEDMVLPTGSAQKKLGQSEMHRQAQGQQQPLLPAASTV